MDVLSPQLMWIDGRCYRVNTVVEEAIPKKSDGNPYMEEDLYDTEETDEFNIELANNGRFKISYHIPQIFFHKIIGPKGETKKRIEAETKTQIKVPRPGVEGDVEIWGLTRQSVASARRRVDLIVLVARNEQMFTHFLCVPFTSRSIKESFIKFRDSILRDQIPGMDISLFQNPNKLHLTIVTLSLMDNDDRALAARVLQESREYVIEHVLAKYGPIQLHMQGLEYMNDDPSSVDVLYGKIESEALQLIADGIANRFADQGLTQKKADKVKIHVTLINSLFRDEQGQNTKALQKRQTFDARRIIETYGNFDFGIQVVDEIHLSQRYSTSHDGFYEATGVLKLS